jgi:hypothetical protein
MANMANIMRQRSAQFYAWIMGAGGIEHLAPTHARAVVGHVGGFSTRFKSLQ